MKPSKKVFTTKSDPAAVKPANLVQRRFKAVAPRRLWVADITYVDAVGVRLRGVRDRRYSRRIVGWNVAATLKADILPFQALDMAAWAARREGAVDLTGLIHHADHGSNYLSIVSTDRISELGAKPSTGTVGESFDSALAEAVDGLYKTELIRRRGPWRTIEQVELATLEDVWRRNNQRLPGEPAMRTPIEVEAAYYAAQQSAKPALAGQGTHKS